MIARANESLGRPVDRRNAAAWLLAAAIAAGIAVPANGQESKGFTDSLKSGMSKITGAFSPKEKPEVDELDPSLSLKNKKEPSARLFVSVARLYEQGGKYGEAEANYRKALDAYPTDVGALLGYAELKERLKKYDDALKLYQRAAEAHPQEASVYNNWGLFYARQRQFDEAVQKIGRAVLLQPTSALYRNNIATVLVDMGKLQEAYSHMQSVHGEAGAYYNLGYLLARKGQREAALRHFELALRADPDLAPAKVWIANLQGAQIANAAAPNGVRPNAAQPGVAVPSSPAQPNVVASRPSYPPQSNAQVQPPMNAPDAPPAQSPTALGATRGFSSNAPSAPLPPNWTEPAANVASRAPLAPPQAAAVAAAPAAAQSAPLPPPTRTMRLPPTTETASSNALTAPLPPESPRNAAAPQQYR